MSQAEHLSSSPMGAKTGQQELAERSVETFKLRLQTDTFREIKLLLLGSGESGKSTIVKQMKIIHGNGYSEAERVLFRPVVFCNTVQSLYTIIKAMTKLRLDFDTESCSSLAEEFTRQSSNVEDCELFPPELAAIMMELWKDSGIQAAFVR